MNDTHELYFGAGVFEGPGQTMDKLSVFGTSRYPNRLKSEPELPCHLTLRKISFLSHKISHLWPIIAIV